MSSVFCLNSKFMVHNPDKSSFVFRTDDELQTDLVYGNEILINPAEIYLFKVNNKNTRTTFVQ